MNISSIRSALVQAYELVGLGLPTAYSNAAFTPPASGLWAKFSFLPTQPQASTLGEGGFDTIVGVAQIDLNTLMGSGEKELFDAGNALRNHFVAGLELEYDQALTKIVSSGMSQGRTIDSFYRISFTIEWHSQLQRSPLT